MIFKLAIVRSFFFTLLLIMFSINISYGYVLSGFIGDNNSGVQEWHVVARETSNSNLGNDDTNISNDPNDPKYRTYEMALFPGNYDVHCESEILVSNCIVTLSSPIQNVDFPQFTIMHFTNIPQLDSPVHITGSVINDQGSGIPSVIVSATSSDGVCTSSSESDGNGSFDLTVIPGTYTLLFSAPETTTYVNKGITGVVVTGNTVLNDTILNSLIKYLLSGYFNDQSGTHTLGEYDSALINADNPSILNSIWTSTNNDSFIFDLFAGSYTITAVLYNYDYYNNVYSQTSTTYQVFDYLQQPDDQNTLGITLLPYYYYLLEGTVTDNQGIPIPDVMIEASGLDGRCSGRCTTDSLGYYALSLIPGSYVVTAIAPPDPATYPPYRINNIDISGDCQRDIRLFLDDTILKDALDQLSGNIALDVFDIINQGNTLSYDIEVTGSRDLLEITLNWNWADMSQMSLEVRGPNGTLYGPYQSIQPPILVDFPNPAQGTWTCTVTANNVPYSNYPFALVAGLAYALNASVSTGHGTIAPASGTYSQGRIVSLTATPDPGYRIKAWHGTDNDSSKSTTNSVTMNATRTVTVEFELIPTPPVTTTYTLNASVSNGNGTIQPGSGTYSQGTVVSLSATPGSGYQVKAWHGTNKDSSKSTGNSVTMNANRIVTVEFELISAPPASTTYTLNASVVNGHGAVTVSPSSGPYSQGTTVSLSAAPENGYKVKAWTGTDDDASTAVSNTVTMNAERIVTVEFVPITNPADTEGKGGGGGGGCYISTCAATPLPLSMIPLIILFGIVFIGLSFLNRLVRNSLYNEFFKK